MEAPKVFDDRIDDGLAADLEATGSDLEGPAPFDPAAAVAEFMRLAGAFDLADRPPRSKVNHTLRVAWHARELARAQDTVDERWAMLAGLLHDVSRFFQWAMYGDFSDRATCDHGDLSAALLDDFGYLRRYIVPAAASTDEAVGLVEAVRLHNKLALHDGLDPATEALARVLRDADKIDILHLFTVDDIFGASPVVEGRPSEEALRAVAERRCCDRRLLNGSASDTCLSKACLAFGMETGAGRESLGRLGYAVAYLDGLEFRDPLAAGAAADARAALAGATA